jgi:hypothetical protein
VTAPKKVTIEWAVEAARNRVFYDPATKELLIFSKQTWLDLPIQGQEAWEQRHPKPSGWRFKLWSWWHGPSVARFLWRNKVGLSCMTPSLREGLYGQRAPRLRAGFLGYHRGH